MSRIFRALGSELVVHVQNFLNKLPQFKSKILAYFRLGGFVVGLSKIYRQEENVSIRTLQIDA